MAGPTDVSADELIRIMVATDNHLGYAEKDAVRGEDSFTAFEEILEMALEENVDMILLGGDLFHDAVPSQNAFHKCTQLLRRYTFGDKPITLEMLSDQSLNFHNAVNQSVNFEDPNLNISIPVFSIHGNHDDPSGFGRLSTLDLLSTTGLVNYFGRWTDLSKVDVKPILLRKGENQLALYGLSHIHDARLARLFGDLKVNIECQGSVEESESWFHLMVLHQNRADRGLKNYVPEEVLPCFLNLVIWGHEHDCRIEPEYNTKRDFYVCQPGSSVPTSLAEGEALKKHVGLLEIHKNKFCMKPLPLQTVRPFVFESVNLMDYVEELKLADGDAASKVSEFARQRIEAMIKRAQALETGHPRQPKLPLIRLRLLFDNEAYMFNTIRFGGAFSARVANPADVVVFKKVIKRQKAEGTALDKEALRRAFEQMEVDNTTRVEELVDRYFSEMKERNPLKLLNSKVLTEMTYRLVERRDNITADNLVKYFSDKAIEHLMETLPNDEEVDAQLLSFQQNFNNEDMLKMLDEQSLGAMPAAKPKAVATASHMDDSSDTASSVPSSTKTRGRGRGGTGAGTRGRAGSANASTSSRGTGRARATTATTRAMPQLDVTTSKPTRATSHQQTLLSIVGNQRTVQASKKKPIYISDSDSD